MEQKVTIIVKIWVFGYYCMQLNICALEKIKPKHSTKKNWTKTLTQKDLVPEKGPTSIHLYIPLYKK